MSTVRQHKRWRRRIAVAALGLLLAVLLAEVGLRVAGVGYPVFVVFGEPVGRSLRPGATGWQRVEGEAFVLINSHGMRDREHREEMDEGTFRIAIVGDSFTEAMQVPVEETFWAVLERELQASGELGDQTVEVLNFGVFGLSTAQELIMWRTRVRRFSPDLVLLCVCTGNDIIDNSRTLASPGSRPFFYFEGDGLALDESYAARHRGLRGFLSRIKQEMKVYSRILQLVDQARHVSGVQRVSQRMREGGRTEPLDLFPVDLFLPPQSKEWQEAWRITEFLIQTMAEEVREEGARFAVATLSNAIQVHPDRAYREAFTEEFGIEDLFYPDHRIQEFGERNGIRVISLAEPMQRHADERGVYVHGFANSGLGRGHWNAAGHQVAGRVLASELLK